MRRRVTKEDPQFVTALGRGLDVLRCFTPERPEIGTTEIASLTGLPQPTVWRLCYTLSKLGYLVRGRDPEKLRAGAGVLALGCAAVTHAGIAEFAAPLMKEIADRFETSVSLAARDRLTMVIIQRAEASSILKLNLHIGSALGIERSALGWAYLSGLAAPERDILLGEIARAAPEQAQENRRNIDAAIKHYRRHGYVINLRQYHPGVNALGVPVVAPDGSRVIALNCGGASTVITERKLRGSIAETAMALAAKLGPMLGAGPPI
jgi:DNA-binding IclR family transcriptional regulator